MSLSSRSAAAGLAAVGLLVARPARLAAQAQGIVTGRVTATEGGDPIAGATIAVTGTPFGALTRSDGSYRLTLRPGRYEVRARLIGFGSVRDSITVVANTTTTQNFRLSRAAAALDAVAVTGSRTQPRTVVESPVPVDILGKAEIRSTGRTETAQILQQLAPSVNFPRATISDGTDHVRPATLRGLGADQVLVLLNGRRRHTAALVNVNGSVGRGQAAVDLNAIPANMIERIEVLRDGAAAQYGSDAIAGVINIVLKGAAPAEASLQVGQHDTEYGTEFGPGRRARDGRLVRATLDGGLARSDTRYVHAGGEFRDRGFTNRTLGDPRPQSFAEQTAGTFRDNVTGPLNHRQGDAAVRDATLFFNAGWEFANGISLYAFGGGGRRDGESAGFFRRGQDDRTVRALFPDGFLPLIRSDITDASTFAGVRGSARGWKWEASTGIGGNSFGFEVANSNNASLGAASPRAFGAGTLGFSQWTTNLDASRGFTVATRPLRLATGAEFRTDYYRIEAGTPPSYEDGRTPILNQSGASTGRPAAPGAQVFPGFRPTDAGRHDRSNVAVYLDAESDLTSRLLLSGAVRYEHYSDFGGTTTGKVAGRYKLAEQVVFRGAAATGFRAPSLQQSFYSATATNFINGVPFDVKTAPVGSEIARTLGARPLRPETSRNLSGGVALEPVRNLALTVDYYRITIEDRVVLSENFTGAQVAALLQPLGASGARYFTNAIDTRTNGVDVVANYGLGLGTAGYLRLTGGYNHNRTRATRVASTPPELGNQSETLFGRVERSRLEEGQPRNNVLGSVDWSWRRFGVVVRGQRFGEVTTRATVGSEALDQTFSSRWIADLAVNARLLRATTLTLGVDNLLDTYPDQNSNNGNVSTNVAGNANFGIFPYSQFSPFGFNGRFLYARVTAGF